jgi:hypothetical protein
MAIESSHPLKNPTKPEPQADNTQESLTPVDIEDMDANEDELVLPTEGELANKKVAVRRKIEMYWEKRRLREQVGDFGEIDFDFDF